MIRTDFAVYVGIVYSYLPFMILPLYATLERMDDSLVEAALDLGCRPWQAFVKVTLPLSLPGIVAGSLLVFIPAGRGVRDPGAAGRAGYPDDRQDSGGRNSSTTATGRWRARSQSHSSWCWCSRSWRFQHFQSREAGGALRGHVAGCAAPAS